jgi:hypothetical protein
MPRITVSSAATARALVPLSVVKGEIGITGTASDTKLARWIAEETGRICQHCGVAVDQLGRRTFAAETLVVTYDAAEIDARCDRKAPLILPWRIPVTAVGSVVADGTTLEDGEYEAEPMAALLHRLDGDGNRTSWSAVRTVVTLTAGWDLDAEEHPEPLRRACLELVRARWLAGNRDPNLKVSDVPGVLRQEFWVDPTSPDADGLPSEIAAMVHPYSYIPIG